MSGFADEKFVIGTFRGEGLFSSFLSVVGDLIWAEKNQKVPVVYWTQECLYAQKDGYKGNDNPWEYYFAPVSSLTYQVGDPVYTCCDSPDHFSIISTFMNNRNGFDEFRFRAKATIDKMIRVKPDILEKMQLFYEEKMLGKTTIGIHLRGTDRTGVLRKEDYCKSLMDVAEQVAAKRAGDVQFFIATDEESLLDLAKGYLKRPIVYCDSHRSQDDSPLHIPKKDVEREGAILGEEALIEVLLLSKCDFLSCSLSSFSIAVLLFNPTMSYEYQSPYRFFDPAASQKFLPQKNNRTR